MGYRLEDGEPLPAGLRRILAEQLDGALDQLHGRGDEDRDLAVHDARKRFKKSRAVLRLVRDEIGDDVYRAENAVLRDAGRELSAARDAAVLVETARGLNRRAREAEIPTATWRRIGRVLRARRTAIARDALDPERTAAVTPTIEALRGRVEALPIERDEFDAVRGGLRRAYRRGARGFDAAFHDRTEEAWHAWRKRAKDLWYMTRILRGIGPLAELEAMTGSLGDLLGLEHDHAVLQEMLAGELLEDIGGRGPQVDAVTAMIERRRAELQAQAIPIGRLVYAERPGAFLARTQAYWLASRAEPGTAGGDG